MASGSRNKDGPEYIVLRSERRKNLRKQILVLKVRGSDDKGSFFGYAKTLGAGGMFIASVNPRKVGEQFEITFTIPKINKEIRCACEVVWRREYDPKVTREPGMGIRFVSLGEETKREITGWLSSI